MAFDQKANLQFVLTAKDLASKTFKEARGNLSAVDKAAGKTGKSFKGLTGGITPMNLALGAAALGATVLVGGLIAATKAAIAEEKNVAKLTASLKANIRGFNGNTTAIEKTIASREKLAFSDDELRDSLAKLVGVTHNVDAAFKVQRVAMDLARFKGISLSDATEALTKVEAGSYRILKSLGIQLPKNATAQEALTAVEKIAAGQSEAYANTVEGKMLTAQIKMDDAAEDFGRVTMPIVAEALNVVTRALDRNSISYDEAAAAAAKGSMGARAAMLRMEAAGENLHTHLDTDLDAVVRGFAQMKTGAAREIDKTVKIVKALPGDIAKALTDHRMEWQNAWTGYLDIVKTSMSRVSQIAKLEAILASHRLADGLRSGNPEIRAAAESMRDTAKNALIQLRGDAKGAGSTAGEGFADRLGSKAGAAHAAGVKVGKQAAAGLKSGFGHPTLTYSIQGSGKGAGGGKKAARGGLFDAGDWVTVGESGQERVHLFPGGGMAVFPNTGVGSGPSNGGGWGGIRIIQLVVDRKVLAETVDHDQFYRRKTSPR